ncbi:hypothetical protein [Granulicella sp. dw_53]|uniref:hypothetical protein n=1 Tax=Granulicella sp. dw_53 TaxID=2719792 RepID=UPI001BD4FB30|nr:hypothetical protein [Granulicella sp. dw_53]
MTFDPKSGEPKNSAGWEERLHEAGQKIEEDLRRVIVYINDEVVPEVRRNSSAALRAAAEQMEKLAQRMEERTRGSGGPSAHHAPKDEEQR